MGTTTHMGDAEDHHGDVQSGSATPSVTGTGVGGGAEQHGGDTTVAATLSTVPELDPDDQGVGSPDQLDENSSSTRQPPEETTGQSSGIAEAATSSDTTITI